MTRRLALPLIMMLCASLPSFAQTGLPVPIAWAIGIDESTQVIPNIVYSIGNGHECKLDLYLQKDNDSPRPTLLYIHGGGWVTGSKEGATLRCLPYLAMGFSIVNVEYRLANVSLAPAAVEDCRLALRWVFENAKTYHFDTSRIVVSGGSAGGHLALMTGMLNHEAGFDAPLSWDQADVPLHVAAIINWFGITDVKDLLAGDHRQQYAVSWIGSGTNHDEIADRVSPLSYVRKGLPPIFSVHGDRDDLVHYSQAVRLHKALSDAGVPNQLITIPGGGHGGFTHVQMMQIYAGIREFLLAHGILKR